MGGRGSPAAAVGSREQVIAHPLLAELRLTEASVTQLAEACGIRAAPGRFKYGDHRAPDCKATPPGSLAQRSRPAVSGISAPAATTSGASGRSNAAR
jgi:hypothetical protein